MDYAPAMTIDELVEAWQANNALNLELLDLVADDDFALKPGKGKTIRSNFVHLVGVRRIWLEEKMPAEAKARPAFIKRFKEEASKDATLLQIRAAVKALAVQFPLFADATTQATATAANGHLGVAA